MNIMKFYEHLRKEGWRYIYCEQCKKCYWTLSSEKQIHEELCKRCQKRREMNASKADEVVD